MKTLILVRHGSAEAYNSVPQDIDRELVEIGRLQSGEMGKRLSCRKLIPDLISCSPAIRAGSTAELLAEELGYLVENIMMDRRLYGMGVVKMAKLIFDLDDGLDTVMLVGHNPEMEELANQIAPGLIKQLPTCGCVIINFDVEMWDYVSQENVVNSRCEVPIIHAVR